MRNITWHDMYLSWHGVTFACHGMKWHVLDMTSNFCSLYFLVYMILSLFVLKHNINTIMFSFFPRQLCLLLNSEDIYRAMSEILLQEEDFQFASLMVRYLNMILLTSSELFDLRDQLRELATAVRR